MAVYEDDPRVKPKLQSYGGGTNRGAAKRGEPKESTGSTESKLKKDPRLPAAPKERGKDRLDFKALPLQGPLETKTHKVLKEASPYIDASIRELMRKAGLFGALLEKRDSARLPSKPSMSDWLDAWKQGYKGQKFRENDADAGIRTTVPEKQGAQMPTVRNGRLPDWSGRT